MSDFFDLIYHADIFTIALSSLASLVMTLEFDYFIEQEESDL